MHLTKTGGESVLDALGTLQKRHCPVSCILDQNYFDTYSGQLNLCEEKHDFSPSEYMDGIKSNWNRLRFAFVRNPWARLVSDYHYNRAKGIEDADFNEYINRLLSSTEDVWKWSQVRWLSYKSKFYADRIYKLEIDISRFEKDFAVTMPHNNKTEHKPYQEYYNDRTRNIIKLVYADDIKEFDYEF